MTTFGAGLACGGGLAFAAAGRFRDADDLARNAASILLRVSDTSALRPGVAAGGLTRGDLAVAGGAVILGRTVGPRGTGRFRWADGCERL